MQAPAQLASRQLGSSGLRVSELTGLDMVYTEGGNGVSASLGWYDAQAGEVVVDVRAAGVNFPDVLTVQGKYQHRPELLYFDDTALPLWPVDTAGLEIAELFEEWLRVHFPERAEHVAPHPDGGGHQHDESGEQLEGVGDRSERDAGDEVTERGDQERDEPGADPREVRANKRGETAAQTAGEAGHGVLGGSAIRVPPEERQATPRRPVAASGPQSVQLGGVVVEDAPTRRLAEVGGVLGE